MQTAGAGQAGVDGQIRRCIAGTLALRKTGEEMGLDGIELLMAVDEEFKIAISYEEAAHCVTVGKLVDLVHSRLQKA